MRSALLLLFIIAVFDAGAQDWKRTQNWYFGNGAGLSFATDPPTVMTDGAMSTDEGCATISDTAGNLLLYTNGLTVWNKNHQIMDNGTGLLGRETSTQSSLVVPYPGNDSLFYIFTTDGAGLFQKGFQYNIVNIRENGGLGKVTSKNNLLVDMVCEKLTATHHSNGKDIWVLVHGFPNDSFYAYLVTEQGLINCPIISKIGSVHGIPNQLGEISRFDAQGAMKFNIKGNLLAVSVFGLNKIEVFGFDNSNGRISYKASAKGILLPYGLEFSPNSEFLYCTDKGFNLLQFHLAYWQSDSITNSRRSLANSSDEIFNQLQLASNGVIYVSKDPPPSNPFDTLGQINNPNLEYPYCDYIDSVARLQKNALLGLPNFITSYFKLETNEIRYSLTCPADSGIFFGYSPSPISSWSWELRDVQGILIGSASSQNTTFYFPDTGRYSVRLIANTDTLFKEVYIEPELNIGQDTLVCNQSELMLQVPQNFRCIQWYDGSDTKQHTVSEKGIFTVSAINYQGCRQTDSIHVDFKQVPQPIISQRSDTLFTDTGYSYRWYYNGIPTGGNDHFLHVFQNGTYTVEITDSNGCSNYSLTFPVVGIFVVRPEETQFRVYPIPSREGEVISVTGNHDIHSIHVHDMLGREIVGIEKLETREYQIRNIQRGLYILTVNQKHRYTLQIE